ncbi:MAG: excinuclease ABC subunit UvrC [Firmicutes bacterium]|nr:excinuclease ABC subunit UvrC [Bacillota bacterium]
MTTLSQKISNILKTLPHSAGVYFFKNSSGEILYIGKANNLKNRVSSYFNSSAKNERLTILVQNIDTIDYILAISEKNALSLEANLVKFHQPKFNILLKDGKSPPYIRIKLTDDYPSVEITRTIRKDGAKYFGPYFGGVRVNDVVNILKSAYKVRTCTKTVFKSAKRECLDYHINLCFGTCQNRISKEEYHENLSHAIAFLRGKDRTAHDTIFQKMMDAADKEEFERAMSYKEQLATLEKLKERELTDLIGESGEVNLDAYSIQSDEHLTVISQVIVRGAKLMGINNYSFETLTNDGDALMSFMTQYYSKNHVLPEEILIDEMHNSCESDFAENTNTQTANDVAQDAPNNFLLEDFLQSLSSRKIEIVTPQKGKKKSLVKLARENALEHLEKGRNKDERELNRTTRAADDLAKMLKISSAKRIECYDISNISGSFNVASRVVFENGVPSKKSYRHYKIKTVVGADDFASMAEVIARRFRNSANNHGGREESRMRSGDEDKIDLTTLFPLSKDEALPSLIVIDGGRGQLSSAVESLKKAGFDGLNIIGLAKKEEEIYLPNEPFPLKFDLKSNAMLLLIRIRDEAHRFALKYHKKLREKI